MREAGRSRVLGAAVAVVWRSDPRGTLVAGLLQIVGALGALAVVGASKLALDAVIGGGDVSALHLALPLVLLALSNAASVLASVLQVQHQRVLGERVNERLWETLLRACVSVDLMRWESTEFMERLDRVRANALTRPTLVVTSLFNLVGTAVGVLSMLAVLVAIHPALLPVLLLAGLPAVLINRVAARWEFGFVSRTTPIERRRTYLKQLMTGREYAAEVRAFDSGPHLQQRHALDDRAYLAALRQQARRRQLLGVVATLISTLALAITLVVVVVLVRTDRISLAEAGAAVIAARLLSGQLSTLFTALGSLVESGPYLRDMTSFLADIDETVDGARGRDLTHELRLDDVTFCYPGRARSAVDGVSIGVPRGRVAAVVEENGSGKTTVAKIVAGLYEPQAGAITWDGEKLPPEQVRAGVSVLFQDFVRYQMNARDNVTIAHTDHAADEERLTAATRRAKIDDVLTSLPAGYDTGLGQQLEEGTDLSGGQWQRVALARAFFRDTPVIVLDEPTAAMDPVVEHELFADVRQVLDGRSALLISHRFSSVRLADYIYVMSDGRVSEEGTHDALLADDGRYAEMYRLQAAAYLDRSTP